jgi:hypothetical protein
VRAGGEIAKEEILGAAKVAPCYLTDRISAAKALRGRRRAADSTKIRRGGGRRQRAFVSCKCW